MNVRDRLRRRPAVRYLLSVAIAVLALGLQLLTRPAIGPDTYQIFLGAVALSVIFAGTRSGLVTLSVSAVLKLYFFILPESTLPDQAHIVVARMALFLAIGLLICSIGGQLHASEGTLSAVLNGIADGVIATDDRGRVRFLNPVAQALTGWKLEHAQGQLLAQVARFERDGHPLAPLSHPPESADHFPPETTLALPTGLAVPVEGSVAGVRIPGEPRRVVVVFRDITGRRRAEAERERLIAELRTALAQVKHLSGLLPICASCKKIRDDQGYWHQIEAYIGSHSEAEFSHGICPECARRLYPDVAAQLNRE